jgi:hypothetical protein
MPDRVIVEILVAAPIDTVWKAIKDPAEVRRWFGWDYPDLAADVEGMWAGNRADDTKYELHTDPMPDRFKLEDLGTHTIVRIIRSAPADDPGWQGIYDDLAEGWLTFVQQLKFLLERHPAADRRTVYLNGRAASAATPQPVAALGLDALGVVPIGERYAIETAAGEKLAGTVWYRATYQLGLTVDGYGDGLLILGARPRTEKSHHGGGSVIVTTYGLDDGAFQRVQDRWKKWWAGTYEVIEMRP